MEALVPSRTISSVIDEKAAGAVEEVARIEDRMPSQIVNAPVRLYTRLRTAARQALRNVLPPPGFGALGGAGRTGA